MTSRGIWALSKDYPFFECILNVNGVKYRITASSENKSHIYVIADRTEHFRNKKDRQNFINSIGKKIEKSDDPVISKSTVDAHTEHNSDSFIMSFDHSIKVPESNSVRYKIKIQLNPGSSIDTWNILGFELPEKNEENASGNYEIIK